MVNKLEFRVGTNSVVCGGLWRWAQNWPKRIQNLGSRDFPKAENGKVKPPKDLSAWVARWADRTGCRVAVPNTGSRWVGVKKCYMKGCEWEKILTAMENRERRGKEETLLEDSKGSICECIYTSRTSQDFSLSYLIL